MTDAKEYALRLAKERSVVRHRGGDEKDGLISVRWEDERHWAWFRLTEQGAAKESFVALAEVSTPMERPPLRAAIFAAIRAPGALTATARAIAPAWGVSPESAQSTLCAWAHGRRKAIPLRAIEAALAHLDIEPDARAELAGLRAEIERAEARIAEIVG